VRRDARGDIERGIRFITVLSKHLDDAEDRLNPRQLSRMPNGKWKMENGKWKMKPSVEWLQYLL